MLSKIKLHLSLLVKKQKWLGFFFVSLFCFALGHPDSFLILYNVKIFKKRTLCSLRMKNLSSWPPGLSRVLGAHRIFLIVLSKERGKEGKCVSRDLWEFVADLTNPMKKETNRRKWITSKKDVHQVEKKRSW